MHSFESSPPYRWCTPHTVISPLPIAISLTPILLFFLLFHPHAVISPLILLLFLPMLLFSPSILLCPQFDRPLYAEELYDHRGDKESDLGKKELINVAKDPFYQDVIKHHRSQLLSFLYNEVIYYNISSTFLGLEYGGGPGGGQGNKRRKWSIG